MEVTSLPLTAVQQTPLKTAPKPTVLAVTSPSLATKHQQEISNQSLTITDANREAISTSPPGKNIIAYKRAM